MNLNFEELIQRVADFLKSETRTETVVGQPFQLGDFTCVPIIRARMGFGTGGGEGTGPKDTGSGEGAALGAGVSIEPVGFLVAQGGEISFIGATKHSGVEAAFEKVPDLLEKLIDSRSKVKMQEAVTAT